MEQVDPGFGLAPRTASGRNESDRHFAGGEHIAAPHNVLRDGDGCACNAGRFADDDEIIVETLIAAVRLVPDAFPCSPGELLTIAQAFTQANEAIPGGITPEIRATVLRAIVRKVRGQ